MLKVESIRYPLKSIISTLNKLCYSLPVRNQAGQISYPLCHFHSSSSFIFSGPLASYALRETIQIRVNNLSGSCWRTCFLEHIEEHPHFALYQFRVLNEPFTSIAR
ncbi:MAG: hypothetical protein ACI868_001533 [Granulosicoccus sp.]|jgi:hypothetical protein